MPAIKFADEAKTALDILMLPYGGPINGRDLEREFFSVKTDFCLDWYPDRRPLLYHHGLDGDVGVHSVGHIEPGVTFKSDGGWVRAQLDKRDEYYAALTELIAKDALSASSGAMSHLVKVNTKTGHIDRWPFVEGSLTPTPCNITARVGFEDAEKHYKSAGLPTTSLAAHKDAPSTDDDGDDDAVEDNGIPDTWFLHVRNGKRYGLYKDGSGMVDGALLQTALHEVQGSDLPDDDKMRVIARGTSIAIEHGMNTAVTVTDGSGKAADVKATWTTAFMNDLPDSSFLYVEPGGEKDGGGKTAPRTKRHFPYKDGSGKVDMPHLRNALARIPQSSLPDDVKARVTAKARRIATANGIAADEAKAMSMPMPDTDDGEDGDGYEGSYEDLICDLRDLLNPVNPWTNGYSSLVCTYPDYLICCRREDGDESYWRIPYAVNGEGEPELGTPMEVAQTYTPIRSALAAMGPFVDTAHFVATAARAFEQRTKDLLERRIKEGRPISSANRSEITTAVATIDTAVSTLKKLLADTDRSEKEAAKALLLSSPESLAQQVELFALYAMTLHTD